MRNIVRDIYICIEKGNKNIINNTLQKCKAGYNTAEQSFPKGYKILAKTKFLNLPKKKFKIYSIKIFGKFSDISSFFKA